MQSLFGSETEYGLAAAGPDWTRAASPELLARLMELARARLPHINDSSGLGFFTFNSSRIYVDDGLLELSIGETCDPTDAIRHLLAGDRILTRLIRELGSERPDLRYLALLKSNVCYANPNATSGSHESYLHVCPPAVLADQIIPHLVARISFTGAGGWRQRSPGLEFTLSPRSHHLLHLFSSDAEGTMGGRGLYHTKDKPLCGKPYKRLHLLCGESLCSHRATWLRLATTALVVAMCDGGRRPGDLVRLDDPLTALRIVAGDPTCSERLLMADGGTMTAVEIERHFLLRAIDCVGAAFMPPWTEEACVRWGEMLDELESNAVSLRTTIDWRIKLALFEQHSRRRGIDAESWPARTDVAERVEAGRIGKPRGFSDFQRVRQELFEIATRWGELGTRDSLFAALDRAGVLTHHVPGVDDLAIEHATRHPPASPRAELRGQWIRRLAQSPGRYSCGWTGITDHTGHRCLDLSDPFTSEAQW